MWRLFQPLDYLLVHHPEKKLFDWAIPLIVGVLLSISWANVEFKNTIFETDGFISQIQNLLSILTGFFIAALAAVATFDADGKSMDSPMPGKTPVTLRVRNNGGTEKLSRRRFLCLLFGYLAFLSLALFLVGVLARSFHKPLWSIASAKLDLLQPNLSDQIAWLLWLGFCIALIQLMTNTLLGLFYLTDRIHRKDGLMFVGKPTSASSVEQKSPSAKK
jgi:hypothetical protein